MLASSTPKNNQVMSELSLLSRIAQTPHGAKLGLELISAGKTTVTLKLPFKKDIIGDPIKQLVHSGAVTSLIDTACGAAIFHTQQSMHSMATLDLRVEHLMAAETGRDIFALADCYHLTHTIAFVRVTAYTDEIEKPIATATATFMRSSKKFPIQ